MYGIFIKKDGDVYVLSRTSKLLRTIHNILLICSLGKVCVFKDFKTIKRCTHYTLNMVSWNIELGDWRIFGILLCLFVCDSLVAKPMLKICSRKTIQKRINNFLKYALCLIQFCFLYKRKTNSSPFYN